MTPIPLVDLKAQYRTIRPEIDAALALVLDRCDFILGRSVVEFEARLRIDTPTEADYFRNGGVLNYVLRMLASR